MAMGRSKGMALKERVRRKGRVGENEVDE